MHFSKYGADNSLPSKYDITDKLQKKVLKGIARSKWPVSPAHSLQHREREREREREGGRRDRDKEREIKLLVFLLFSWRRTNVLESLPLKDGWIISKVKPEMNDYPASEGMTYVWWSRRILNWCLFPWTKLPIHISSYPNSSWSWLDSDHIHWQKIHPLVTEATPFPIVRF